MGVGVWVTFPNIADITIVCGDEFETGVIFVTFVALHEIIIKSIKKVNKKIDFIGVTTLCSSDRLKNNWQGVISCVCISWFNWLIYI